MTTGTWAVRIERLVIELAVGVHAHERAPQPVEVSVVIKGRASACPDRLGECLDYDPLLHWLTTAWPASAHVGLLEERLNELFVRCFGLDHRVDSVWAGLYKRALGGATGSVGIERALSRREFQAQRLPDLRRALPAAVDHGHAAH